MKKIESISTKKINPHVVGIILVITDSFFFSMMSMFVRLSGDVPTMQKAFFRNAVALVIAVITLIRSGEGFRMKKGSLPFLIARSFFGGTGMILNFWAIDRIGLADANILNKMSPFFAIIFSIFILSEFPDAVEIVTVIIAFIGAAFVVKPSAGLASLPAFAGLLGGLGAGIAYVFVRKLGKRGERGTLIVAFFSAFTCLLCLPFMLINFHPMTIAQTLCLIGAGSAAAIAQFAVTAAYKYAPAKEISVFDYSQVLFASIWGILLFDEIPDRMSLIGYVIIITVAVIKWYYNMHQDKKEKRGHENAADKK